MSTQSTNSSTQSKMSGHPYNLHSFTRSAPKLYAHRKNVVETSQVEDRMHFFDSVVGGFCVVFGSVVNDKVGLPGQLEIGLNCSQNSIWSFS